MPAKTAKQQRFFGYLKTHPAEAQARGISAKVADEFAHKPAGGYPGKKKSGGWHTPAVRKNGHSTISND